MATAKRAWSALRTAGQGLLLLLLPGVLLRLELLHVLLLLSLDEVLQAHSSHEELGLDEDECQEAQRS